MMKKALYWPIYNPNTKVQNHMKRNILILFAFFLLHLNLIGQSAIIADPAINEESFSIDLSDDENTAIIFSSMVNNTDATVDVKWVQTLSDAPAEWKSKVCDNRLCYDPPVYSNIIPDTLNAPITLAPGEAGTLNAYIEPHGVAGSGMVTIELYDNANPETLISTGTYMFHIQGLNTSIPEVEKSALQVYPNPSPDYFQLTNASIVDRIVVYNIVGRVVKTFDVYNGERYDIADLSNGMYLVSLINEKEGIMKTVRFSKRSFRP